MSDNAYIVLDLETTGLHPRREFILECGIIYLDDIKTLNVAQTKNVVLHYEPDELEGKMNDVVLKMHTESGLLEEVYKSTFDYPRLDDYLTGVFEEVSLAVGKKKVLLVGNSVHFDVGFIREKCPHAAALLHHRVVDVSGTLRTLYQEWCDANKLPAEEKKHRALDDCEMSLNTLRWFRDNVFLGR